MDDRALARLEHENLIESLRLVFGHVPGALIAQEGDVTVLATGLAHPFFNQVLTDAGATEADLRRAVELVRTVREGCYVVLRQPQDRRFGRLLRQLGLTREDELLPGMAVDAIAPPRPAPEELHVHVVTDAEALSDHATALGGFGFPDALMRAFLGEEIWLLPDCTTYVGYAGGEPVVSGVGVRTGRAIGVYSIATLPAARRRGYGAAMTERILADGVAAGCDVGVLQASSMGRPIYERLGFRLVQEYEVFTERAGGTDV